MGYRSEVKCVIYSPYGDQLQAYLTMCTMKGLIAKLEPGWLKRATLDYGPEHLDALIIHEEYVKWYDMFDSVVAVGTMLDLVDEREDDMIHYEFVRIGEESDDTEIKRSQGSYGLMWVARTVAEDFTYAKEPTQVT